LNHDAVRRADKERPEVAEARRERFATLRTLLTLDQLGTS